MPVIHILLDGEGAFLDVNGEPGRVIHLTGDITFARLPHGMTSGRSSVMIRIDLPDGRVILQETSLAMLVGAARALEAAEKRS